MDEKSKAGLKKKKNFFQKTKMHSQCWTAAFLSHILLLLCQN